MPAEDWEWWGNAGHFISWRRCLFHLHTHVNGYCISTLGDYHPNDPYGPRDTIAGEHFYETMIWKLGEDGETEGEEVYGERYLTGKEAHAAHMSLCRQYDEGRTVVAWVSS